MGRPPRLCPLCPDSRSRKGGYSIETCAACDGHFCQRHIRAVVKDDGIAWMCRRCLDNGAEPRQLLKPSVRHFMDVVPMPSASRLPASPPPRPRLHCQLCPASRAAQSAEHICPDCGRWVCDRHSTTRISATRDSAARVCSECGGG